MFETGDAYFVTGDLLRRDPDGDYWFVDRLADVVLTAQGPVTTIAVDDALCRLPDIRQAVVYGVTVAGEEHQALCAAVVTRGELDLARFTKAVSDALPAAKRPRFVRVVPAHSADGRLSPLQVAPARRGPRGRGPLAALGRSARLVRGAERRHGAERERHLS